MAKSHIRDFLGSRWKVIVFFVLPYISIFALYYHFGDELSAHTILWSELLNHNDIIAVTESIEKQFGSISVSRDASVSSDTLDLLLTQYGVDPTGMPQLELKIDLLLKVSSPDFWRKNYLLHPKVSRIKTWIWIHQRYLYEVAFISKIKKRKKLKKRFLKFSKKLQSHSQYEELMLFKFINDNLKQTDHVRVDILQKEHAIIHNISTNINDRLEAESIDSDQCEQTLDDLFQQLEQELANHFEKEEQNIVHLMLNIDNSQYRTYRSYLSWKFYFMY